MTEAKTKTKAPAKKAAPKAKSKVTVKPAHYDVLQAPLVTEKSTFASEQGKVIFRVKPEATKPEIKEAIETLFKVDVVKVNTNLVKGKKKLFRGRAGVRSDFKKAIVTLKSGQSIDFAAGV